MFEIQGSHGGEGADGGILCYDTVLPYRWLPMFLRDVGNHLTKHAASQPRRPPVTITMFFSFVRFKCYSLNECLLETAK